MSQPQRQILAPAGRLSVTEAVARRISARHSSPQPVPGALGRELMELARPPGDAQGDDALCADGAGYRDDGHPVNTCRTVREPFGGFAEMRGFE
jgi:hypothetical protein